ncbi:MAG: hypothetical protein IPK66_11545 [Rhodospirillales bacterium]|nr:hypothetical protein [Rhodospirillales bacterium]
MNASLAAAVDDAEERHFVPALIAVLVYLACVFLAAMLVIGTVASSLDRERSGRLVAQLPAIEDESESRDALEHALASIRAHPEVARADALPGERLEALLQPWLVVAARESGLPLPTVIEVELRPDAGAQLDDIRAHLQKELPGAQIDAGTDLLAPVLRLMRTLEGLAVVIVAILAATLAAAVVFATRLRMAARQETIEVLHLLGADDQSIVAAMARRALLTALLGGLAGFAAGIATLIAFAWIAAPADAGAPHDIHLSVFAWALVAIPPLAAAAIAGATARFAARRALRAMP